MLTAIRLLRLQRAEVLVRVEWWADAPDPWGEPAVQRLMSSVGAVAPANAARQPLGAISR
jgi:hypothetical protein